MLELAVYEPHPFIAGELAEEQKSKTFSFIRGAGVEGYKLSAESIIIKVPMNADEMEEKTLLQLLQGTARRLQGSGICAS